MFQAKLASLFKSQTSKDTAILFIGNSVSAFLGFVFVYILTRALTKEDFGVFSAAANLIVITSSLTDLGITTAMINFVSKSVGMGKLSESHKYLKASFVIRFAIILITSLIIFLFSKFVSKNLLSTTDATVAIWVAVISIGLTAWLTFPYAMMAYKKFWQAVVSDWSLGIPRILFFIVISIFIGKTLNSALIAYALSTILPVFYGFSVLGTKFLKTSVDKEKYVKLSKFSGWLGVNKIISSVSGRMDIQMLAYLTTATLVADYSIAARLSSFVIILCSSVGSVLSTRFANFNDFEKEKDYLVKSILFVLPIVAGVIAWIFLARPFILLLFGTKYAESIVLFQYSLMSLIPFVLATPAVTAIVHAMRKPVYVGIFSFPQILLIFFLNLYFIKLYGGIGPSVAFLITHSIMAIYAWVIASNYYFKK